MSPSQGSRTLHPRGTRPSVHVLTDAITWTPALLIAGWLRLDVDVVPYLEALTWTAAAAFAAQCVVSSVIIRFRGRQVAGGLDDLVDLATAFVLVCGGLLTLAMTSLLAVPRSIPLIALLVALPLAVSHRLLRRIRLEQRSRPDPASAAKVIVFGVGWGGQHIVRSMLRDAESGYLPVAFLDDDPRAVGRRISGVPVCGNRYDIARVATRTEAELLVVAIRDLDVETTREISRLATGADLQVKVIPALKDQLKPTIGLADLQDLDIADLIGRKPIEVDVSSIAGYLTGRCVLVTGAGGSIGSELCRQVHRFDPSSLLMLDRDESALHALQLSISGRALLDSPDVILADIRDAATIYRIFAQRRPDVVFHAAALKHLPMLEQYPDEAWQTNVLGTENVVEAALASGVRRFVNISTDKAANPTSVLGLSKRVGERLVAGMADRTGDGVYVSVRFGNVIGSRGSVLTTFAEQISSNQPITVTHPDVTRFFMTIPEAVRLVVQAAAIGRPRETLVLDMGEPVRIVDIARALTELAGRSVQILYTGLRDGEKLHEELFGDEEYDIRPIHPAVSHVTVPPLPAAALPTEIGPNGSAHVMRNLLVASPAFHLDTPTERLVALKPSAVREIGVRP